MTKQYFIFAINIGIVEYVLYGKCVYMLVCVCVSVSVL